MLLSVTTLESTHPHFPTALQHAALIPPCARIWAIGDPKLAARRLLGLLCSTKCPGNVILQTYDLIRAVRDAEVAIIGGFHSPMEQECLDLLLRGRQPVIICPARSLQRMQLPKAWHKPVEEGRLLVLSPFSVQHRRPTAPLAEQRNRFVAALADALLVTHAAPGSRTAQPCTERMAQGQRIYTLHLPENAHLLQRGVIGKTVNDLVEALSQAQHR